MFKAISDTWGVISTLSIENRVLLFGGLALFSFSLGFIIAKYLSQRSNIKFYENRDRLNDARGKLIKELETTKHVWIAAWAGAMLHQTNIFQTHKVTKLVLFHPSYEYMEVFARITGANKQIWRNCILDVSQDALNNNVPVYWLKEPFIGMVIANAELVGNDKQKWARIDDFIPYGKPDDSPNYVISPSEYPNLFHNIVRAFTEAIKDKGTQTIFKVDQSLLEGEKTKWGWKPTST